MLKSIFAVLAAAVIGLLAYVALQPPAFHVERSTAIAAPPDAVFSHINDFHKWQAWSPWVKRDPKAKEMFEGPASGTGAVFGWNGNDEVGEGKMTITVSKPNEAIKIKLDFVRPFPDTSDVGFTLKPDGGNTLVTWTLDGQANFMGRLMCTLMGGMDRMLGPDYEAGLANLKSVVEGAKPG